MLLKLAAWLICLQNKALNLDTVEMRLKSYDPRIYPYLRSIEEDIHCEFYDTAEATIDYLRDEHGEFSELVGLQARLDVIQMLKGDD